MITLSFLQDLFQQDFMLRALLAGMLLGMIAPIIGSIVVIRRLSFIADTLGHFSLVGISVSLFMSTLNITIFFEQSLYMAIIFSIVGGLLIELFRRSYTNYKEISMIIVISIGAAISAIFFSLAKQIGAIYNYLFGSILTIQPYDILLISITAAIVGILFVFFGKQILSVSLDETFSKFLGVNVNLFQLLFMITLSIAVSVLLRAAGVLLISSMMIIPVAAGMKLGWSYRSTIIISFVFSELSVFFGLWISYSLAIPSGAAIVSISVLILLLVTFIKKITLKRRIAQMDQLQK